MTGRIETSLIRYVNGVVSHPWWTVAICLALITLAGVGLTRITVSADYRVFFSPDDPQLQALEAFEANYTRMDTILLVVKPVDGDIFSVKTLSILDQLTTNAWQIPHAIRVDSVTNFQHLRAFEDDIVVTDLVENPQSIKPEERDRIRAVALADPALKGRLVANDGGTAGILVTLQLPDKDHTKHIPQSVETARIIVAQMVKSHPDIQIAMTGLALMSYAQMEVIWKDIRNLVPLMFGIMVILLFILLRSLMGVIACLVLITLSVLPATGIMGWLGMQLNQASASAPIIIMTLAIADCVHLLTTAFQRMADGLNKKAALIESFRINAKPVFLTSLTTGIGFLSLNFSDSQPFRELGNYAALGVFMAWFLSMTLMPAMMAIVPLAPKPLAFEAKVMRRVGDLVIVHRLKLLWVTGMMAVLASVMIPSLEIEDRYVEWFDESTRFRQDTDFASKHLTGPYMLEFSLPSGTTGGIADVQYLKRLEAFVEWLESQDEVVHVSAFTSVMKRLNRAMHGDDPSWYRLPGNRELAAQYTLLYEMSLPYGLDLNNLVNSDKSASRVTATLTMVTSKQLRELADRAQTWLVDNAPSSMHTNATGIALIFAYIGQRNIESMLWGTVVAFTLISVIITLALRDIRLGLISLVSNTLPVLITFGLWAVFVGEIGIIASVITATSLGLIVDDTVHFLSRYQYAKHAYGISLHDSVRFSFDHVGSALLITTAVLVAGFLVLTLSVFALNVQLGALTAMTLVSALLLDALLLPPLIMWLDHQVPCMCNTCLQARVNR